MLRSIMRDDRLEAVAGPTVTGLLTQPSRFQDIPFGGTVLFAGHWMPVAQTYDQGQQTIAESGVYAYMSRTEPRWANVSIPLSQRSLSGTLATVWVNKSVDSVTAIGRHPTLSGAYDWAGPMAAVAYGRTLSPVEIAAVLRWLTLHLAQPQISGGGGARSLLLGLRRLARLARAGWAR